MDQTKFINSYIANLAEQLKASTLDIIMLKTQLGIANDTNAELLAKIAELESALEKKKTPAKKDDWQESNFTKDE